MSDTAFHVMAKPSGFSCNLDCTYCYYLEKETLYPLARTPRMNEETLAVFIREYIAAQPGPDVHFAWQGGEPTLMGVEFFENVVHLQREFGGGRRIHNALQTNGTLLDDRWGEFLAANKFLVGISLDGPASLHDCWRKDRRGGGTFERVMRGLEVLKRHGVEFNTLTVVHRLNSTEPLTVYEFLLEAGSRHLQFIPLVERVFSGLSHPRPHPHALAGPPQTPGQPPAVVTGWSVLPEDWGRFLIAIYDRWVRRDVGRVFIPIFEAALANWLGLPPGMCIFSKECGDALVLEHNGDLYACDHYVYPEYHLGNIARQPLGELARSMAQRAFGAAKASTLPGYCRRCDVLFACRGECPKHRFLTTPDGEPGLNYLCAGYKAFFCHITPSMEAMAWLLRNGRAPSEVMELLAARG